MGDTRANPSQQPVSRVEVCVENLGNAVACQQVCGGNDPGHPWAARGAAPRCRLDHPRRLAHWTQEFRTLGEIPLPTLDKHRRHDAMPSRRVAGEVADVVRDQAVGVPQMVVCVDDRQIGFDGCFVTRVRAHQSRVSIRAVRKPIG
jgi:hypothetical protein